MKKAILYGASGLVGFNILQELLWSNDYDEVIAVVRTELPIKHYKLKVLTGDFGSFVGLVDGIKVDEVYIALGTTRKKTPDNASYYQVDHDYPVLAAKIAKENGASSVFFVSSIGANVASSFFYPKTKGQAEQDIILQNFEHTHIFRPSTIIGNRTKARPVERVLGRIWEFISPVLTGKMNKYRSIEAKQIATAMINAAKNPSEKSKIYHWHEMIQLV
ncbi:NAD(P)H-binding protein [Mucilaginibacter sp. HC2]|uniref:NAD(P)H-binding protein n=1 Tax=Mucilaginibacter inviolabilis TaxID=2714892 RepID=UPI00140C8CDB|nr:NAD(P)H-binding protein [Mucilaginibacter inviolabilis]NHA03405.1 NAD(P)H-binding protein [Mucilaginibacter inviolabilis]